MRLLFLLGAAAVCVSAEIATSALPIASDDVTEAKSESVKELDVTQEITNAKTTDAPTVKPVKVEIKDLPTKIVNKEAGDIETTKKKITTKAPKRKIIKGKTYDPKVKASKELKPETLEVKTKYNKKQTVGLKQKDNKNGKKNKQSGKNKTQAKKQNKNQKKHAPKQYNSYKRFFPFTSRDQKDTVKVFVFFGPFKQQKKNNYYKPKKNFNRPRKTLNDLRNQVFTLIHVSNFVTKAAEKIHVLQQFNSAWGKVKVTPEEEVRLGMSEVIDQLQAKFTKDFLLEILEESNLIDVVLRDMPYLQTMDIDFTANPKKTNRNENKRRLDKAARQYIRYPNQFNLQQFTEQFIYNNIEESDLIEIIAKNLLSLQKSKKANVPVTKRFLKSKVVFIRAARVDSTKDSEVTSTAAPSAGPIGETTIAPVAAL